MHKDLKMFTFRDYPWQWRHNGRDGAWKHRSIDGLLEILFMRRSKKTSKPCVTGLWGEFTGDFLSQRASNVSIWWRYHFYEILVVHTELYYSWSE